MNNYRKGYELERKCKKILEEKGWLSVRSPASKSPLDILAVKGNHKLLIQCKKTGKEEAYISGLRELMKTAEKHGAKPLLVYSLNRTGVFVKEVKTDRVKLNKTGKHQMLEKYLDSLESKDGGIIIGVDENGDWSESI